MKNYDALKWNTITSERLLHTPVFDVLQQKEKAATGLEGNYVALTAPEWVVVLAVHGENFVLVRQWRHGEDKITLEFPGGVAEPGETAEESAARELEEETGFRAGRITCLGRVSSNPALFKNHFSVVLAEDLVQTGELHLDADEILSYEELPIAEVFRRYGDDELTHAYMGTALAFYLRKLLQGKNLF